MAYITFNERGLLAITDVFQQKDIVQEIGGVWDGVSRTWTVAFTVANLEHLMDHLGDLSVDERLEDELKDQAEREEKLTKLRAMSKMDMPVRLKVPGLSVSLYNYQKLGVMYSLANDRGVMIADEMGLGKTIQALATALYRRELGKAKRVLVVTPASLKFNWPIEIDKFTKESYVVIDGPPDDRIAQWLRNDVFFTIVNYELLLEDLFGGRKFKSKPDETKEQEARRLKMQERADKRKRILTPIRERLWDMIVVDEAHMLKKPTSARSKNVKSLRSKFRMALTGTPLDGRLEELHSVMEYVMPGLLGSRTRFLQRHANMDFYGNPTGYKRIGEVTEKVAPYMIRRHKKDVLKDLPDKIYQNRMVVFSAQEKKLYKELASQGHEATENEEAMVACIRCKQFCDYPNIVEGIDIKNASKLEALKEVLEEVVVDNGHKALLFTQYSTMAEHLLEFLDKMGLSYLYLWGNTPKKDRAEMQEEFNNDKSIDLMIGTEAMSMGLNFTAADYVFNYDDNWQPAVMSQREDRAHRIGQKNVVTVVNFVCKDTIEERIRSVLYSKGKVSAKVLGDDTDEATLRRLGPQEVAKLL